MSDYFEEDQDAAHYYQLLEQEELEQEAEDRKEKQQRLDKLAAYERRKISDPEWFAAEQAKEALAASQVKHVGPIATCIVLLALAWFILSFL